MKCICYLTFSNRCFILYTYLKSKTLPINYPDESEPTKSAPHALGSKASDAPRGEALPTHNRRLMTATTRKPAASAPEPKQPTADDLFLLALAGMAKTGKARATAQTQAETLAQPLTARETEALARLGWQRLSSPKPAAPKPTAKVKDGPTINPATYNDLTKERQQSLKFWAGLCATLSRSNGKVWLPEVACVACELGVMIASPSQLANRLSALTGRTVSRPAGKDAGWLHCDIEEGPQAEMLARVWALNAQAFQP